MPSSPVGHLHVPRKRIADIDGVPHKIGQFLGNTHRRADKLTPGRRAELDAPDTPWAQEQLGNASVLTRPRQVTVLVLGA
ncbi:hypothetical protein SAMN05216223_12927 [Actinacidiphila yanglinensis]|uniref:Uncharacterized protein n=1 Tax=Actinacidiphila yanglinensis TaxID=310779 RepID=A0A1H6E8P3_9ACTN|nr:helicase associated domain-containing protein [Actinacidiphila yanglinensis]SEG94057.1 hypothetical protein SAMN05216223_12927 [Actinacidiphila yanglinensis]